MSNWFEEYRLEFESRVVVGGIIQGVLGSAKKVRVKPGRLEKRRFGTSMGTRLETSLLCVVDYYGLMKKSEGFDYRVRQVYEAVPDRQVRAIEAPVVHFAGIRLEEVAKLAPDLVANFARFKKRILDLRGFNHNYQP